MKWSIKNIYNTIISNGRYYQQKYYFLLLDSYFLCAQFVSFCKLIMWPLNMDNLCITLELNITKAWNTWHTHINTSKVNVRNKLVKTFQIICLHFSFLLYSLSVHGKLGYFCITNKKNCMAHICVGIIKLSVLTLLKQNKCIRIIRVHIIYHPWCLRSRPQIPSCISNFFLQFTMVRFTCWPPLKALNIDRPVH